MRRLRALASLMAVVFAAVMGIVGTGLIYQALSVGSLMALVSGLSLALVGLYWCGRALAQSQRYVREHRLRPEKFS
jgi:ABC-type nickel/cobalt efflux system permease component RcnA